MFGSQQWKELKEPGKALGAVVPNLKPKTKYEVMVAAMTSAGLGPFLRRSAITTEKPGNFFVLYEYYIGLCDNELRKHLLCLFGFINNLFMLCKVLKPKYCLQ